MIDVHQHLDLFYLETDPDLDNIPKLMENYNHRRKYTATPGVAGTSPQKQMADLAIVDKETFLYNFNVFT